MTDEKRPETQQGQQMTPLEFGNMLVKQTMQLAEGAHNLQNQLNQAQAQLIAAQETIKTQAVKIKELNGDIPSTEDKKNAENA